MQTSEPSTHSWGGRSQLPPTTAKHSPTLHPTHHPSQAQASVSRPLALAGACKQEKLFGGVARAQGADPVPRPSLGVSKIALLRTDRDRGGEGCQLPWGFPGNGKKAPGPWRAGVGPLIYLEDSQHQAQR